MPVARRMARRRTVARAAVGTAVVTGTAGAVRHHQDKKYAAEDQAGMDQQEAAYEQGIADAQAASQQQQSVDPQLQAAPVASQGSDEVMADLEKLGELHEKGILTDEEFAAKKQELLAKM